MDETISDSLPSSDLNMEPDAEAFTEDISLLPSSIFTMDDSMHAAIITEISQHSELESSQENSSLTNTISSRESLAVYFHITPGGICETLLNSDGNMTLIREMSSSWAKLLVSDEAKATFDLFVLIASLCGVLDDRLSRKIAGKTNLFEMANDTADVLEAHAHGKAYCNDYSRVELQPQTRQRSPITLYLSELVRSHLKTLLQAVDGTTKRTGVLAAAIQLFRKMGSSPNTVLRSCALIVGGVFACELANGARVHSKIYEKRLEKAQSRSPRKRDRFALTEPDTLTEEALTEQKNLCVSLEKAVSSILSTILLEGLKDSEFPLQAWSLEIFEKCVREKKAFFTEEILLRLLKGLFGTKSTKNGKRALTILAAYEEHWSKPDILTNRVLKYVWNAFPKFALIGLKPTWIRFLDFICIFYRCASRQDLRGFFVTAMTVVIESSDQEKAAAFGKAISRLYNLTLKSNIDEFTSTIRSIIEIANTTNSATNVMLRAMVFMLSSGGVGQAKDYAGIFEHLKYLLRLRTVDEAKISFVADLFSVSAFMVAGGTLVQPGVIGNSCAAKQRGRKPQDCKAKNPDKPVSTLSASAESASSRRELMQFFVHSVFPVLPEWVSQHAGVVQMLLDVWNNKGMLEARDWVTQMGAGGNNVHVEDFRSFCSLVYEHVRNQVLSLEDVEMGIWDNVSAETLERIAALACVKTEDVRLQDSFEKLGEIIMSTFRKSLLDDQKKICEWVETMSRLVHQVSEAEEEEAREEVVKRVLRMSRHLTVTTRIVRIMSRVRDPPLVSLETEQVDEDVQYPALQTYRKLLYVLRTVMKFDQRLITTLSEAAFVLSDIFKNMLLRLSQDFVDQWNESLLNGDEVSIVVSLQGKEILALGNSIGWFCKGFVIEILNFLDNESQTIRDGVRKHLNETVVEFMFILVKTFPANHVFCCDSDEEPVTDAREKKLANRLDFMQGTFAEIIFQRRAQFKESIRENLMGMWMQFVQQPKRNAANLAVIYANLKNLKSDPRLMEIVNSNLDEIAKGPGSKMNDSFLMTHAEAVAIAIARYSSDLASVKSESNRASVIRIRNLTDFAVELLNGRGFAPELAKVTVLHVHLKLALAARDNLVNSEGSVAGVEMACAIFRVLESDLSRVTPKGSVVLLSEFGGNFFDESEISVGSSEGETHELTDWRRALRNYQDGLLMKSNQSSHLAQRSKSLSQSPQSSLRSTTGESSSRYVPDVAGFLESGIGSKKSNVSPIQEGACNPSQPCGTTPVKKATLGNPSALVLTTIAELSSEDTVNETAAAARTPKQ
ncbi:unnamed protein product [Notodromas monacha]|uniref:Uncharacterized protein n=1 Tax=Notodromas monacha TaxID=399045 RepID=A0A7R9BD97_9CRUS|nr:unnamed protein product [Notodromas monacha]CAG0913189.1 unnamed protein product [Notodromas monacha]